VVAAHSVAVARSAEPRKVHLPPAAPRQARLLVALNLQRQARLPVALNLQRQVLLPVVPNPHRRRPRPSRRTEPR